MKSIIKTTLSIVGALLIGFIFLLATACGGPQKEGAQEEVEVEETVEANVWLIDEHQYQDIPLTSIAVAAMAEADMEAEAEKEAEEATEEAEEEIIIEAEDAEEEAEIAAEEAMMEESYEIASMQALEEDLLEQEYEALASTVVVTEAVIPLDETQTVVSYNKKGEENAALQVVSDAGTGEIHQVVFMDKKHRDVYDVTSGMSGKEVKKLRREVKHMVKKGQVFLYDDQSNIMYLMNAQNMVGDEVTAVDVETMEVQAIVWKDKKHHKKNK